MKVSDLQKDRAELRIELDPENPDEVLNVVYNPKAYTIEMEENLEALDGSDYKAKAFAVLLVPMLLEWDLYNEEPGDYPPTEENLKKLPVAVLGVIVSAIGDASRPDPQEGNS